MTTDGRTRGGYGAYVRGSHRDMAVIVVDFDNDEDAALFRLKFGN